MPLYQNLNGILKNIKEKASLEKEFLTPLQTLVLKSFLDQKRIENITNTYFSNMNRLSYSGETYTPIQKVSQRGEIEGLTKKIVSTIVSQLNKEDELQKDLKDCLNYVISELLNNIADHSGSYGWAMAQYYPTKQIVEVAVIDVGCGFLHRLSSKFQNIDTEIKAIDEAVKKGVTASFPSIYGGERNSGYGLFIISNLANQINNSDFLIASNEYAVYFKGNTRKEIKLPLSLKGSLVCFSLNINMLKKIEYDIDVLIRRAHLLCDEEDDIFEIF